MSDQKGLWCQLGYDATGENIKMQWNLELSRHRLQAELHREIQMEYFGCLNSVCVEQYAYFGHLFRRKIIEGRLAADFTADERILLPRWQWVQMLSETRDEILGANEEVGAEAANFFAFTTGQPSFQLLVRGNSPSNSRTLTDK